MVMRGHPPLPSAGLRPGSLLAPTHPTVHGMKRPNPVAPLFGGSASRVFRGMATLALGSTIAKAIAFLAIPILTRIYTPEDYGVLSVFNALVFMLVPVVTLYYVLAIPLPRHRGLAMNLLVLCILLNLLFSLLITVLFLLWGGPILSVFSMEQLEPYGWLIGIALLGTAGFEITVLWATRARSYRAVARASIVQSLAGALTKLVLGLAGYKPLGLLLGQVVTQSAGMGSLWRRFQDDFRQNVRFVRPARLRLTARLYWQFPAFRLPSQLLLVFSIHAPLLLVAMIYEPETTGQLGLTLMALAIPMALVGDNMSKAYYAEISALGRRRPQEIQVITWSVLRTLTAIAVVPIGLLIWLGEPVFALVFGENWAPAGRYASILALVLMSQFVTSPVVRVFSVLGMERMFLFINIQCTAFIALAFLPGFLWQRPVEDTLWLYSVLLSAHRVFTVIYIFRVLNRRTRVHRP